jgi:hypothetical protein
MQTPSTPDDSGCKAHRLAPAAVTLACTLANDDGTVLFAAGRRDFMSGNLAVYCAALAG